MTACLPSHRLWAPTRQAYLPLPTLQMSIQVNVAHWDSQNRRAEGNLGSTPETQFSFSNIGFSLKL